MLFQDDTALITEEEAAREKIDTGGVQPISQNGTRAYSLSDLIKRKKIEPHSTVRVETMLTAGIIVKISEIAKQLKIGFHEAMRDLILTGIIAKERHIDDANRLDQ